MTLTALKAASMTTLIALAASMLLPPAAADTQVGQDGTAVWVTTHEHVVAPGPGCNPRACQRAGEATVDGHAVVRPVPDQISGIGVTWRVLDASVHSSVDVLGLRVDRGSVEARVGPFPPTPGPGPCGVTCIHEWIDAMQQWARAMACSVGVCPGGDVPPVGSILCGPIDCTNPALPNGIPRDVLPSGRELLP